MESNHFQIIKESIEGLRGADEKTSDSIAVLNERLEMLKKCNTAFSGVCFSRAVDKLRENTEVAAFS